MPHTQALLSWASEHGTALHPHVEIYRDPITGSSFRALQDIKPGEKIVNCSFRTMLSYLNAVGASSTFQCHSPPFPPRFIDSLEKDHPNIIGYFFLIQQYLLGDLSFWANYIRLLPQPDAPENLGLPSWWPDADQAFLAGMNAEPAIQIQKARWKEEWNMGLSLLEVDYPDSKRYTYHLYQWAASIFGSRSFRPSLTIPAEFITATARAQHKVFDRDDLAYTELNHIKRDNFSVLLPVADIGNHNGINQLEWSISPAARVFTLSNLEPISKGSQIYNYYGDKSNSELLVAYGFILPESSKDRINLRLIPPRPELKSLRRSQRSHRLETNRRGQAEFMYYVGTSETGLHQGIPELNVFSRGLVDTMSCMTANTRERRYLQANPNYSLESDPSIFHGGFMSRNAAITLRTLLNKLYQEASRINTFGTGLGEPVNQNQRLALEYRNRSMQVLQSAIRPLSVLVQSFSKESTALQQLEHGSNQIGNGIIDHGFAEFISLASAYGWLEKNYPELSSYVEQLIADDQEEPRPIDWSILIQDWGFTYWIVWIYLLWLLWLKDKSDFKNRHPKLAAWIDQLNRSYNKKISLDLTPTVLCAEPEEQEIIDPMVRAITLKLGLAEANTIQPRFMELRNFASFVTLEEGLLYHHQQPIDDISSEGRDQKLICVWSIHPHEQHLYEPDANGPWTDYLESLCVGFPGSTHP